MPRTPGIKNGEGKGLAPIKNWKPWMTKIVILHMAGMGNEAIAAQFPSKKDPNKFLSKERVSQIINDEQGQQMIRGMNAQVKRSMEENLEEGMLSLAEKSMKRLEETIGAEFNLTSDQKKHQDHVALSLVKNFISGEKENAKTNQAPVSEQLAERFITALEKANEARGLSSGKDSELDGKKEIVLLKQKVG